jgi:diguanylate cyclase (GGDEF)-like protein
MSENSDIAMMGIWDRPAGPVRLNRIFGTFEDRAREARFSSAAWPKRKRVGLIVMSIMSACLLIFTAVMVLSSVADAPLGLPLALNAATLLAAVVALYCMISNRPGTVLDIGLFFPCLPFAAFLLETVTTGTLKWDLVPGPVMTSMFVYGVFLPQRPPYAMATVSTQFAAFVGIAIYTGYATDMVASVMTAAVWIACLFIIRGSAISARQQYWQKVQAEDFAERLERNLQDIALEKRAVERAAEENAALADELALARMAADENTALLELLLDTMSQGVICYGPDTRVIKCNNRYAEFMRVAVELTHAGTPIEKIFDESLSAGIFGTPKDRDLALERVKEFALAKHFDPVVSELETAPGFFVEIRTMPFPGGGAVSTITDISARKVAEHHILHKAHHDALTGLANRNLFKEKLEAAIARSARVGHYAAVAMIDLDGFKPVNDTYGHPTGDALLREVAALLTGAVREIDTVARLGGDEFAIVFDGIAVLKDVSTPIDRIFQRLQAPIRVHDNDITIGASMGVSFFPLDGESAADLEKAADQALLDAKRDGRSRYYFAQQNHTLGLPSAGRR